MRIILLSFLIFITGACSVHKRISRSAHNILSDSSLTNAHIGISIFDPALDKYLFTHQGNKYFVPASNVKIPTCYAALKYLPDSIPAARIEFNGRVLYITPTGDPTFLHPDFAKQPLLELINQLKPDSIRVLMPGQQIAIYGSGWGWSDYDAYYMAERSLFPVHGNLVSFSWKDGQLSIYPEFFAGNSTHMKSDSLRLSVTRDMHRNSFTARGSARNSGRVSVPFRTDVVDSLLTAELGIPVSIDRIGRNTGRTIYSQPKDSVLKIMMHVSDNFYAEQMLLMAAYFLTGKFSDRLLLDSIVKSDFSHLPQKPRWADGSGLSRYNLFSPNDMVEILELMRTEFGLERLKAIFPTGNEGTLTNYYKSDSLSIYAKTGTLSGVVGLSGYLITESNRLLIFSVLVNNHQSSAPAIRRLVEMFIGDVRKRY